jgi:hypothetical protein
MSEVLLNSLITTDLLNAPEKLKDSLLSSYKDIFEGARDTPASTYSKPTGKEEIYEKALQSLRTMQGEIHPGWNDEYVPVRWVLDVVDKALGTRTL